MNNSEANKKIDVAPRPSPARADDGEIIATHLPEAEFYFRREMGAEIVRLLEPFLGQYPFGDTSQRRQFNRLLGFGYFNEGRMLEAEDVCLRGLSEEPNGLDYLFLLCQIRLSLREHNEAIEYGQRFLAICDSEADDGCDFSRTESCRSRLHNSIGCAYLEKSEWDEAREQFDISRRLDPGNHLPYINLARLAKHLGDLTGASKVIREGISRCRQIQELELLENELQNSATISACVIVKGEEELLEGCLQSVRGWVDEIILVGVGSSGRAPKIAQSYGAKVSHPSSEDNSSGRRNFGLGQVTGDWVFIIDADERFVGDDVAQIRRLVNDKHIDVISVDVFNADDENQESSVQLPSIRFWRRQVGLRLGDAQEDQSDPESAFSVVRSGARIKRLGCQMNSRTTVS